MNVVSSACLVLLQDISDRKVICSHLETLEKRAIIYNFILLLIYLFIKKEFLNLTINMQLLYFITTVTSQVHSARHHHCAGYSAIPSV